MSQTSCCQKYKAVVIEQSKNQSVGMLDLRYIGVESGNNSIVHMKLNKIVNT